jgi:hypothetical protein
MAETPAGAGAQPYERDLGAEARAAGVDVETVRRLAYELSRLRPDATPEENWLLAEGQLLTAATTPSGEREDRARADEAAANLMAKIEMDVYGHP